MASNLPPPGGIRPNTLRDQVPPNTFRAAGPRPPGAGGMGPGGGPGAPPSGWRGRARSRRAAMGGFPAGMSAAPSGGRPGTGSARRAPRTMPLWVYLLVFCIALVLVMYLTGTGP